MMRALLWKEYREHRAVWLAMAVITALVLSGLPTSRFSFEGFLPRKGSGRAERIDALRSERRTTVLYEAPHRVRQTVAELRDELGALRRVAVVRELTKLHEEVWRGTLAAAVDHLAEREPRGEYVLVLGGAAPPAEPSTEDVTEALRSRLAAGDDKKTATAQVAKELRVPKRQVYEIATRL